MIPATTHSQRITILLFPTPRAAFKCIITTSPLHRVTEHSMHHPNTIPNSLLTIHGPGTHVQRTYVHPHTRTPSRPADDGPHETAHRCAFCTKLHPPPLPCANLTPQFDPTLLHSIILESIAHTFTAKPPDLRAAHHAPNTCYDLNACLTSAPLVVSALAAPATPHATTAKYRIPPAAIFVPPIIFGPCIPPVRCDPTGAYMAWNVRGVVAVNVRFCHFLDFFAFAGDGSRCGTPLLNC
jgi:hypothetical protein